MRIPHDEAPAGGGETVLVVVDHDGVRRYIVAALLKLGRPVVAAANSDEAAELAQRLSAPIGLLVTDVVLPDGRGEDLAHQLIAASPEMSVLYISDHPRDPLRERALPPGFRLLQKPFTSDTLVLHARSALEKQTPRRILIVDDDPAVIASAGRALSHAGFEVVGAENGKRALEILTRIEVHLVVTDLVMPEMEGLELIGVLRKLQPWLPIVAISGAFDGLYLRLAGALGAQAALPKPLSLSRLVAAVRQALEHREEEQGNAVSL